MRRDSDGGNLLATAYMVAAGHEERNRQNHAQRMLAIAKVPPPTPPPAPTGPTHPSRTNPLVHPAHARRGKGRRLNT